MSPNPTSTTELTRAEVKRQIDGYQGAIQAISKRLASMYRPGQGGPIDLTARDRPVRVRAREILNGAPILPSGADGEEDPDQMALYLSKWAVQMIVDTLRQKDTEIAAAEALEKAARLTPGFSALVTEWVYAAYRFASVEDRCAQFREEAGAARELRPIATVPMGNRCEIDSGWGETLDVIVARAVANGLVSPGDVARAKRAKGSA